MTADDKYSLLNRENLTQPFQTQLSQKEKYFSQFFSPFLEHSFNFEIFPKKRWPSRWCISEIIDSEKKVKSMSDNSRLRSPFKKQHGKLAQTPLKSKRGNFYHIHWSLWRQVSLNKSLLDICKMLRLFINTLTAVEKYSLLYRDNLTHPIQIQLSQELKLFSRFFSLFWKSSLNFEHLQKKRWPS